MSEYKLGINKINYIPTIDDDLAVTAYFYSPSDVKSGIITFTKTTIENIYRAEFDFTDYGRWIGVFFENGVLQYMQSFIIERPEGVVYYKGRTL